MNEEYEINEESLDLTDSIIEVLELVDTID